MTTPRIEALQALSARLDAARTHADLDRVYSEARALPAVITGGRGKGPRPRLTDRRAGLAHHISRALARERRAGA